MTTEYLSLQQKLAKNLKDARLAAGFSQEKLALDAGVDRTYVSQIERAQSNPSLLVLVKLANCLKVAPINLLS